MKKQKINIALIGCGRIGFLLENDPLRYKPCTHYGGAVSRRACDHPRLRHQCRDRLDPLRRNGRHPAERTGMTITARCWRTARPDMVIIATWTESHERDRDRGRPQRRVR